MTTLDIRDLHIAASDIRHRLHIKHYQSIVVLTSGDTLMIYCLMNDERLITRYVRRYWGLTLVKRITYSAPVYELRFMELPS